MTHAQPIQLAYGTEPLFPCPARVPLSPSLFLHLLRSLPYIFSPLFSFLFLSFFLLFYSSASPPRVSHPSTEPGIRPGTSERKTMHATSLPLLFRKGFTATLERVRVLLASSDVIPFRTCIRTRIGGWNCRCNRANKVFLKDCAERRDL